MDAVGAGGLLGRLRLEPFLLVAGQSSMVCSSLPQ